MICVLYCLRFIDLRDLFTSVPSDLCIVLSTLHRFTASVYISSHDLCIVLSTLHRFTALFTSVPSDLCIVLSTLHRFTASVYISS